MARNGEKGIVLVAGGAGYIGCALVPLLLLRGYSVRVHDKMYYGDEGLAGVRDKVEMVQGDLRTFDSHVLDGVTAVIHLAGLSNDPTANFNPVANYNINTVATEVLADACKRRGIKRLTFASSASIYDLGLNAEDVLKDEDCEVNPVAPYSTSNFESERILQSMADKNFHPCFLRQGTVYGYSPRMRFDLVVNTFFKDALAKGRITVHNGGEMWRPLVDIEDVSLAHIACIEAPIERISGELFNVVYRNYRILELAHYVVSCLKGIRDVKIDVEYSDRANRSYRLSADKIKRKIGFEPKISVQESLQRMVDKFVGKIDPFDMLHPRYYNISWMTLLNQAESIIRNTGCIF
jgi:nucleoside-diphosphate-sugar epimerase